MDATCWANTRGYGRFTREVCREMVRLAPADLFTFVLDARAAGTFDLDGPNVRTVVVNQRVSPTLAAAAGSSRAPDDMLRLTLAVSRLRPDVFWSPSVYTYFPLPPRIRAVVTVHDAIVERFPSLTIPSPVARVFWRAKVGLAIRQARLVLSVSEFAADDVHRHLGVARQRLRVASEAPSDAYRVDPDHATIVAAARRAGVPEGRTWFTYVGGFNPHKHVDLMVRAHAELCRDAANPPMLLLVGPTDDVFHGGPQAIRDVIARERTAEHVRWGGFVPDDELALLHAGSIALVLPSAAEGFGLPAIEAAAAGAAVIATTQSPLPDLLEGGGLFIDPGHVSPLADAMRRLAADPALRARLASTARTRARALTWEASARSVLAALREAAA